MTEIAGWQPIALRLFLTVIAGLLIGFNRGQHGQAAGLRTTLLVCLAASIAMMQANLLLTTVGRPSDSYVVFDLMRFPLGILTGVGFIGAGAIFRRNDLLRGVTTAATLWFVTVVGLCIGGGQIGLGMAGTAIGLLVLWGLGAIEAQIPQERSAVLVAVTKTDGPTASELHARLQGSGLSITRLSESIVNTGEPQRTIRCSVHWRAQRHDTKVPRIVTELGATPGMLRLHWRT